MRQLLLGAVGALALVAGTVSTAQADSFNAGVYTNGRGGVGINLGISTGNRGGYGYGRGAPVYVAPPVVYVPVPPPTIIAVCGRNPGDWLGADGKCHGWRRVR